MRIKSVSQSVSCIPARPSESLAAAVAAILKAERPRPTAQRMRRSMVNPLHWLVGRAPVVVASNSEPKIDCICVVIEKSNRHRTQLTLLIWVNSLRMKILNSHYQSNSHGEVLYGEKTKILKIAAATSTNITFFTRLLHNNNK